ncbi:hypothetical protein SNK04_014171 [Fusarium graminearum]
MDTNSMASRFKAARTRAGLTVQAAANEISCSRPSFSLGRRCNQVYWRAVPAGRRRGIRWIRAGSLARQMPMGTRGQPTVRREPSQQSLRLRRRPVSIASSKSTGERTWAKEARTRTIGGGRAMDFSDSYIRNLIGFLPPPGRLKLVTGVGDSMVPGSNPVIVLVDTGCSEYQGDGIYLINSGNGQQLKALQDRGDAVAASSRQRPRSNGQVPHLDRQWYEVPR